MPFNVTAFKIIAFASPNTPVFRFQLTPNTLRNLKHHCRYELVEPIIVWVWKSQQCVCMSVLLLLPFLMEVAHHLSPLSLSQPLFPPWAKVLPQNCLQSSLNPKIYHHFPSELHATVQGPADTQETPNTARHNAASGLQSIWNRVCEMNDFYRLLPFMSLVFLWARETKENLRERKTVCISLLLRSFYFIRFLHSTLFEKTGQNLNVEWLLVGTTYCQHVTLHVTF